MTEKISLKGTVSLFEEGANRYIMCEKDTRSEYGFTYTIEPSKEPIEGHFGIFIIDTYHVAHSSESALSLVNLIGIAHTEQEVPDKTYNCAKGYAEKKAENISYIFLDKTSRGNEEINTREEERLQNSLLEQEREFHNKWLNNELRNSREEKWVNPCVSGRPSACFDIGD